MSPRRSLFAITVMWAAVSPVVVWRADAAPGIPTAASAAVSAATSAAMPAAASPVSRVLGVDLSEPHVPGEVIVTFTGGTARRGAAALRERGLSTSTLGGPTRLVDLPAGTSVAEAVADLMDDPTVASVQPNYIHTRLADADDPFWLDGSLWGMRGAASSPANPYGSGAAEAWRMGRTGSPEIVVGVIDEGIQVSHPDLAANIWHNPDESDGVPGVDDDGNGYIDDVDGWDFFNNDATVFDGADNHGTHVAGTIGAVGGNGIGVAGVNWSVKIVSGKFLGPKGGTSAAAIRAIRYMVDLKTRHHLNLVALNNSWGGGAFEPALRDAIDAAGDADILFVAAAGNSASNNDVVNAYPANYSCDDIGTRGWDCLISVAAINSSGGRATFSNYGATKVDLGAPGVGIMSTVSNGYAVYSGSSMATPHITGAVALCASINPNLTARDLRAAVLSSVAPTPGLVVATGGRLDIAALVTACTPSGEPPTGTALDVAVETVTATTAALSWRDGAESETAYIVQRASAPAGTCGVFTTVARTTADATGIWVTGLTPDTGVCLRVIPVNSAGWGAPSDAVQVRTRASSGPYSCAPTPYAWTSATGGTRLALTDDSQASIRMPFLFDFFDSPTPAVAVSSNGFLRLDDGKATQFSNTLIPSASEPNAMVAPWWDDLNPATGGGVYTTTIGTPGHRQLVVSWEDVTPYRSDDPITFQVVLDEATGDVIMRYRDAESTTGYSGGRSASIGLEDRTGSTGTLISYNQASRQSRSAVRCTTVDADPIDIETASLPVGEVGRPYSQTLTAGGGQGTIRWWLTGALPAGLSLDEAGGVISGVPTAAATSTFTVSATDGVWMASQELSVAVVAPLSIATPSLPSGTVGTAYAATIAVAGGQSPWSRSVSSGSLPPGVILNGATGELSGTPTEAGSYVFGVRAVDSADRVVTRSFTIVVAPPPPVPPRPFMKGTPSDGAVNRRYPSLGLVWSTSVTAERYQYCIDTTPGSSCDTGWVSVGPNRTIKVGGLVRNTTYFWQVRAVHATGGMVEADGGTWWRFTTRHGGPTPRR